MDFYPLHTSSLTLQFSLKHRIIFFCFNTHYSPCIIQPQLWHCILEESKKIKVEYFCLQPTLIGFHKILLFRVFCLKIFSITNDGKITRPLTASVYHINLSLNSGFVFVLVSDQLRPPMLGLHFYFHFLPSSYIITWNCFPLWDPACWRLLNRFLSAHQLMHPWS